MASRKLLSTSTSKTRWLGHNQVPLRLLGGTNGPIASYARQKSAERIFQTTSSAWRTVQIRRPLCISIDCIVQSEATNSYRIFLPRSRELHMGAVLWGDKVSKETRSDTPKQDGSVLMQVLEQKNEPKAVTVGAKVVQAGQDFTYIIAILVGFGLVGYLFYSVGSEFFSSSSPSTIFTQALKKVKANEQVKSILGEPITGHGEQSRRGRRRDIAHLEYEVAGVTYMRMKFYVTGQRRKGEVHLDLKKNESGVYEVRFLFVELVGHPPATIIIEDNR